MKTVVLSLIVIALACSAESAFAGSPPPKSTPPAAHRTHRPKVYGTPIQPPIVQKVRTKKRPNSAAHNTNTAAAQKAHAAAARKAKADLEYRRAHPAVSEPGR